MSVLKSLLVESEVKKINGYNFEFINCENEVLEVCEQYNDIVSNEEAISRLEEIHSGLESLLEITESSVEEGGLTPVAAQVLRISTEVLVSPLGLTSPVLSQESFGAEGERLTSTRVSIEEEKGTIKKIWDAMVRAMQAVREKLISWFNAVFNSAKKMKEKNDAILKSIDDLGDKKIDDDKKEISISADNLLNIDQDIKKLSKNLTTLATELTVFLTDGAVAETTKSLLDEFKKIDFNKLNSESRTTFSKSVKNTLQQYTQLSKTKGDSKIPKTMEVEGATVTKFGLLPGNKALYSYYSEEDITKCGWKLGVNAEGRDVRDKIKVDTLPQKNLKEWSTINGRLIDSILAHKARKGTIDDIKKNITTVGNDKLKDVSDDDGVSKKYAQSFLPVLKMFEKQLDSPINQLVAHTIKVSNSLMSIVSSMIKVYK